MTGPEDLEATVEYVKSFDEPIAYTKEGRIKLAEASDIEDPVTEDPITEEPGDDPGTEDPIKEDPRPGEDLPDIKETPGTAPVHQLPPSAISRFNEIPINNTKPLILLIASAHCRYKPRLRKAGLIISFRIRQRATITLW